MMASSEQEIFVEALTHTDEAARSEYLAAACGDDATLRQRLDELLRVHVSQGSVLDRPPLDMVSSLAGQGEADGDHGDGLAVTLDALKLFLEPGTREGAVGRIGHYELLEVLGVGGYGIVFRAFDTKLDRVVAVKVLAPHLAATSPPRRRFLREARAAAAVHHENVVQIYAVEETPLPYLVMEFVSGETLQERSDRIGPFEPEDVVSLGLQIARGLAAAHEKGLIHRDIKPGNILIDDSVEERSKLTDFGLARTADDASLSCSGTVIGTPMYMSPEQVSGAELDQRSDLFSFGSVLYLMATGRPPFRAPSTLAVLKRVAEDRPRAIRDIIPEVPEGLCHVIERLHAKSRDERYLSADETIEALTVCLTSPLPRRLRRRSSDRFPANLLGHPASTVVAFLFMVAVIANSAGWLSFIDGKQEVGTRHDGIVARTQSLQASGRTNSAAASATQDTTDTSSSEPVVHPECDFLVTSTLDDGSVGTLRWAVQEANTHHGEDTIAFAADVFASAVTITLKERPLVLIDPARTTIKGPPAGLVISGGDEVKILIVGAGDVVPDNAARALLTNLTIAHGKATHVPTGGGGVLIRGGSELEMRGCLLRDNAAMLVDAGGGAIFNYQSTVRLSNCTLADNQAYNGGAIKNFAGTAFIANCTFSGNSAGHAGGVYSLGYGEARTDLRNCLFVDTTSQDSSCEDGCLVTGDYNLGCDDSLPGEHSGSSGNARLGPLGDYGGPTQTCPLLTGSSALDAGDDGSVTDDAMTDQRGLPRIANGRVDIGAFEVQ